MCVCVCGGCSKKMNYASTAMELYFCIINVDEEACGRVGCVCHTHHLYAYMRAPWTNGKG